MAVIVPSNVGTGGGRRGPELREKQRMEALLLEKWECARPPMIDTIN